MMRSGDASGWRLRYSELDGVPAHLYPPAARDYALDDPRLACALFDAQTADPDAPVVAFHVIPSYDHFRPQLRSYPPATHIPTPKPSLPYATVHACSLKPADAAIPRHNLPS